MLFPQNHFKMLFINVFSPLQRPNLGSHSGSHPSAFYSLEASRHQGKGNLTPPLMIGRVSKNLQIYFKAITSALEKDGYRQRDLNKD